MASVGGALENGQASGIEIRGEIKPGFEQVLTPEALAFVGAIARRFEDERVRLMKVRAERQEAWDAGALPGFLEETRSVREGDWKIKGVPADLSKRWVEITGPTDRKMVINALNSGAQVYMADFEDSTAPTWFNVIDGQINLRDAIRREIDFSTPEGKHYSLNEKTATLMVRPRGLHLPERHILQGGQPVPGALVDFGLFLFHNHEELLKRGTRPYFYIPKIQHYSEAAWWY